MAVDYNWEYDFLMLAADIFKILVLGLLPIASIIIFMIYMKKILLTWFEMHKLQLSARSSRKPGGRQ
jgi:hypothetical protein